METPKITCPRCGEAKTWECFTLPNTGTILYVCYNPCYLAAVTETYTADDERERRNTYARAYYHRKHPPKTRAKRTPEEMLEARRRASRKQNAKLRAIALKEKIKKHIAFLEALGFKVSS